MSQKFVQFNFPCIDCIVRAACELQEAITADHLYDSKYPRCVTMPRLEDDKSYHKVLIECMANLFKSLMNSVQKIEEPIGINKDNKVPHKYITLFYQMTCVMQYMVNSTSWKIGELKQFDIDEINRKLKVAKL